MAAIDISPKVRQFVIVGVIIAWVANMVASIFVPHYEPNEAINALFMTIVGALFISGGHNNKKKEE